MFFWRAVNRDGSVLPCWARYQNCEERLLGYVRLSVRQRVCPHGTAGRIFVNFIIGLFFENL
jgi:hypothetical protein